MIASLILHVSLSDPSVHEAVDPQVIEHQRRCMKEVVKSRRFNYLRQALEGMRLIETGAPINDPCIWAGVQCIGGLVDEITWDLNSLVLVHSADFLPPTLRRVTFLGRHMQNHFPSRYLPRSIEFVWMENCKINGILDLSGVPEKLSELYLPYNWLQGTVVIHHIPPRVRCVDLRHNDQISHVRVLNSGLSTTLQYILFGGEKQPVLSPLGKHEKSVDSRVRIGPTKIKYDPPNSEL